MKKKMRIFGTLLAIVGCVVVLQPRLLLPNFISFEGPFELSHYGQIFSGLSIIADNLMIVGFLMIVLSFTNLFDRKN